MKYRKRAQNPQKSGASQSELGSVDFVCRNGAEKLLSELRAYGVVLSITPERSLAFKAPKGVMTNLIVQRIRANRDDLLDLLERFEERAAIMEYDGGLAREDAERMALVDMLNKPPTPEYLPEEPGWLCPWCRRGDRLIEADDGMRCGRCDRQAFLRDGNAIVRADYFGVKKWNLSLPEPPAITEAF
jgi:hypothetical protein